MNDNEAGERGRPISAMTVGIVLAGATLFSVLMAFLTVNTPSTTTVMKKSPPTTSGAAPSPR
jgi:hypothetical protein